VLVVSNAAYNASPRGLVVVVPFTTRLRPLNLMIRVDPPEGGLRQPSQAICDQIRAVALGRLVARWGIVQPQTLAAVKLRIAGLLDI
jgi:mRNA interferase MazF